MRSPRGSPRLIKAHHQGELIYKWISIKMRDLSSPSQTGFPSYTHAKAFASHFPGMVCVSPEFLMRNPNWEHSWQVPHDLAQINSSHISSLQSLSHLYRFQITALTDLPDFGGKTKKSKGWRGGGGDKKNPCCHASDMKYSLPLNHCLQAGKRFCDPK